MPSVRYRSWVQFVSTPLKDPNTMFSCNSQSTVSHSPRQDARKPFLRWCLRKARPDEFKKTYSQILSKFLGFVSVNWPVCIVSSKSLPVLARALVRMLKIVSRCLGNAIWCGESFGDLPWFLTRSLFKPRLMCARSLTSWICPEFSNRRRRYLLTFWRWRIWGNWCWTKMGLFRFLQASQGWPTFVCSLSILALFLRSPLKSARWRDCNTCAYRITRSLRYLSNWHSFALCAASHWSTMWSRPSPASSLLSLVWSLSIWNRTWSPKHRIWGTLLFPTCANYSWMTTKSLALDDWMVFEIWKNFACITISWILKAWAVLVSNRCNIWVPLPSQVAICGPFFSSPLAHFWGNPGITELPDSIAPILGGRLLKIALDPAIAAYYDVTIAQPLSQQTRAQYQYYWQYQPPNLHLSREDRLSLQSQLARQGVLRCCLTLRKMLLGLDFVTARGHYMTTKCGTFMTEMMLIRRFDFLHMWLVHLTVDAESLESRPVRYYLPRDIELFLIQLIFEVFGVTFRYKDHGWVVGLIL